MPKKIKPTDRSFYAGIRTALRLLDLHGMDTIYDELIKTCDEQELVQAAIDDDEVAFSALDKHGYINQTA